MKIIKENKIRNIYRGYYKNKPIAIANDIKLLKIYFEVNRRTKNYTIEEDSVTTAELLRDENDNLIMEEYYDVYLPKIDILMIEYYEKDINSISEKTLNGLVNILSLINNIKKCEKEKETILEAAKTLNEISKNEKIKKKMQKIAYKNSPIIYMPIENYIYQRNSFMQIYEMKQKIENGYLD